MGTPLWQIALSSFGATIVGFLLLTASTAVRERPRLEVHAGGVSEYVFVTENRREHGNWSYTAANPATATEIVLTVIATLTNASSADDYVWDVDLHIGGDGFVPTRERADLPFQGVAIPARQAVTRTFRFFIPVGHAGEQQGRPALNRGARYVWSDKCQKVEVCAPVLTLRCASVRRKLLRSQQRCEARVVAESWVPVHQEGTEIEYMHWRPSNGK